MGKGSWKRPAAITPAEETAAWARVFGKPDPMKAFHGGIPDRYIAEVAPGLAGVDSPDQGPQIGDAK